MNDLTQKLIFQINTKTKEIPIIYFVRDAERALGVENLLGNFYIACIEESYITQQLSRIYPGKIFCAEKEGIKLPHKSTLELVNNPKLQKWIQSITPNNKFYAQFFQFNGAAAQKVQNLGGTILNNKPELNRLFEDKISQFKILSENSIRMPAGELINVSDINFAHASQKYGDRIVIQLDRAHTGTGTFIIETDSDFNQFKKEYDGNLVKLSEFIDGEPYTINASITKKGIFIQGLQYQITGYSELTPGKGSTVGNDWSYANKLNESIKTQIYDTTNQIAKIMEKYEYKGIFGVDLIVKDSEIYIIEINARQTANISLQTKLELESDQIPLLITHLAEFLDLEMNAPVEPKILPLEGSQIFLRSKTDKFKVNSELHSGIYRLQSDNSAFHWSFNKIKMIFGGVKENVIFIDEDKDKPLVWQNDGYSVNQINSGGFVLLLPFKGSIRDKFEEIGRMQFRNQIVYNNKVSGWILEALVNIENTIK